MAELRQSAHFPKENKSLRYPEQLIMPMREDLTEHGVIETRTPEAVDSLLSSEPGTVLMVINSVCGCAAGKARPGVLHSLRSAVKPDKIATVFAGADLEAVERVRELLPGVPPSSPSVALFKAGKPVYMMHRRDIEGRSAPEIAAELAGAYQQYCSSTETPVQ